MSLHTATILCPDLEVPINGLINYVTDAEPGFEFGSEAVYTCAEGFGLSDGDAVRKCGPDGDGDNIGRWSGTASTCERT